MNTLKKLLLSLLAMILLVSQVTLVNIFAAGASLTVNTVDSAKVGDEVKCTVEISDNTGWGALQFNINYNKDVLEYVSDTKGSALASAATSINNNDGYVTVVAYNDDNIEENGSIIEVTFKAIAAGTSDFILELSDYYDVDLNAIECSLNNSSVIVASDVQSTTETSTEATTVTTTESTTETTTEVTTKATTEATTKATTEATTAATTEATTKATTEATTAATTETTTEATTETTTAADNTTETTTAVRHTGGGGGGSSSVSATTTTTTTEATTETTTDVIETTTEATTASVISNDVKVSIGSNTVIVGDNSYTMDAAPYIQASSNSTLVPLRFVAIAILGDDIENADDSSIIGWNAATKTASITANGNVIQFTANSNIMNINGNPVSMDNGVIAEITDGRMYIPFRALGNALGVDVDWDSDTKTAIYKTM